MGETKDKTPRMVGLDVDMTYDELKKLQEEHRENMAFIYLTHGIEPERVGPWNLLKEHGIN